MKPEKEKTIAFNLKRHVLSKLIDKDPSENEIYLQCMICNKFATSPDGSDVGKENYVWKSMEEMDAEELRDTTLDLANRTLLKITMFDVAEADQMFRTLMGDKVEERRAFIEKHALEVRNLDV